MTDLYDYRFLNAAMHDRRVTLGGQTYDLLERPGREKPYNIVEAVTRDGQDRVVARGIDTYARGAFRNVLELLLADGAA